VRQLHLAGGIRRVHQDAETRAELIARIAQHGELKLELLGHGHRTVCRLRTYGDECNPAPGQRGGEIGAVRPQGEVAVRAPRSAVEDHHGGATLRGGRKSGRQAEAVE